MPAEDRRKARTRRWLQKALLALIQERGYENVTIQDITDRADTARVTFYRHYKDKSELLMDCLATFYEELRPYLKQMSPNELPDMDDEPLNLLLYRHVAAHHHLYRALLCGPLAALVQRQIRVYLAEYVQENLTAIMAGQEVGMDFHVVANMTASSSLGMIVWWLENDRPCPIEQLAKSVYQFNLTGVLGIIGTGKLS